MKAKLLRTVLKVFIAVVCVVFLTLVLKKFACIGIEGGKKEAGISKGAVQIGTDDQPSSKKTLEQDVFVKINSKANALLTKDPSEKPSWLEKTPKKELSSKGLKSRIKELAASSETSAMSENEEALLDAAFSVTEEMDNFLDDGDDLKALMEARKLISHTNREVRLDVLDSLDWIGLPAAMDAAAMIDDEDSEIQEQARDVFWDMLEEIEDASLRKNLLATALQSSDPAMREEVLGESMDLSDKYASEMNASALNDPDQAVAELARLNMEFISGEDFETAEEAQQWFEAETERLSESEEL